MAMPFVCYLAKPEMFKSYTRVPLARSSSSGVDAARADTAVWEVTFARPRDSDVSELQEELECRCGA